MPGGRATGRRFLPGEAPFAFQLGDLIPLIFDHRLGKEIRGSLGVAGVDHDIARSARKEVGVVEAETALQHARDPGLGQQALQHLRFGLVAGEGDLDQVTTTAPSSATAITIVVRATAATVGAALVPARAVLMRR